MELTCYSGILFDKNMVDHGECYICHGKGRNCWECDKPHVEYSIIYNYISINGEKVEVKAYFCREHYGYERLGNDL